jgi:nicotinate dehydrogenase subunit A
MSKEFDLVVNGQSHRISVDYDQTPLLYVLRDDLKLKGARFGCGVGQCGACTVLVDGRAERSCELPVWSVDGRSVTTVEGLATSEVMHPLQQAFIDFQAGQCAYCISGIIMRAAELIDRDHDPSREKILDALDRNLCRCGSQTRIVKAIESAWKQMAGAGQ